MSLLVWFCDGPASMGAMVLGACRTNRLVSAVSVLLSMLAKEVLKAASSEASMMFPCSASMSSKLVFASRVS